MDVEDEIGAGAGYADEYQYDAFTSGNRRFASQMDNPDAGPDAMEEVEQRRPVPRRYLVAFPPSTEGAPEFFDAYGDHFQIPQCKFNHSRFIEHNMCECLVIYEVVLSAVWQDRCWVCEKVLDKRLVFNDLGMLAKYEHTSILCHNPINRGLCFEFDRDARQILFGQFVSKEKDVVDLANDRKHWASGSDPDEYLRKLEREEAERDAFPRGLGAAASVEKHYGPIDGKRVREETDEYKQEYMDGSCSSQMDDCME